MAELRKIRKMKLLLVLLCVLFLLLSLSACRNEDKAVKPDVVTGGKSFFPRFLAGTWQTTATASEGWEIVLSPEGKLSSAVIPLLGAEIKPNQTSKYEMKDGSFSTFVGGDCPVEYNPLERELAVVVEVKEIHIKFSDAAIDGNSKDIFVGKVSEDGKSWTPDWINIFDYGPRFPQSAEDTIRGTVTFEKASDWKEN